MQMHLKVMERMFNLDKIPPQAIEVEEAVLGAVILEQDAFLRCANNFKPEIFYKPAHFKIASAIIELHKRNEPIDILTVVNELKKSENLEEVGGAYYITQLTNRIASAANIETHIKILVQNYIKREVILASHKIINNCYNETTDAFDIANETITKIENVISAQTKRKNKLFNNIIQSHYDTLKLKTECLSKGEYLGVQTPISKLNSITGGWQNTDLIIIAGRPSMGKTAFLVQSAITAAEWGKSVMIFSLEMSEKQILDRIYLNKGMFSDEVKGYMQDNSWYKINNIINNISSWNLFIDDSGGVNVEHIKIEARKTKQKYGLDIIFIDYLQLMEINSSAQNINVGIGEITRKLKALAKEINIPIVILSQLSRNVEQRANKRPQLSDIRDSGNVEQDADVVIFLYRPVYYNELTYADGESTEGIIELIIKKNRNGIPNAIVKCQHNENISKIFDIEEERNFDTHYLDRE